MYFVKQGKVITMENHFLENTDNKKNNRGKEKQCSQKKKFDFKCYQKNTISSLKEVDYFLNNFQYYLKYIKLYKLLK